MDMCKVIINSFRYFIFPSPEVAEKLQTKFAIKMKRDYHFQFSIGIFPTIALNAFGKDKSLYGVVLVALSIF